MYIDSHVHLKRSKNSSLDEDVKLFCQRCEKQNRKVCILGAGVKITGVDNSDLLKYCKQYSDFLIPFAFVDLQKNVDNVSVYQLKEQGFKGLKCIIPYYAYDHDLYMPIYEEAEKLNMPIVFHTGIIAQFPWDRELRRPSLMNQMPITLDRIARSFQDLKLVMAHLGTTMFREQGAALLKFHPNLYADLAGTGSWQALQPAELNDLSKHSTLEINKNYNFFKKLVFGSDCYTHTPEMVERAKTGHENLFARIGLPQEIVDGIMGKTMHSWLDE